MSASAREPTIWTSALGAQHCPACSGRDDSGSRRSAIIRSSERLNASLSRGSTSTSEGSALNQCWLSTLRRRHFAVPVACYCCFFLMYSLDAVLSQSLQQQQPQQKYSACAWDFSRNTEPDQQRLSEVFIGSTAPVLPGECSEGVIEARKDGETASCRGTGAFGLGAAQRKHMTDDAVADANSISPRLPLNAAYAVRRRLAAVSEPSAAARARRDVYLPGQREARSSGAYFEPRTTVEDEKNAGEATGILGTPEEDVHRDDVSADSQLDNLFNGGRAARRRRRQSRVSAYEPRWKNSEGLPVAVVASAVGTEEKHQTLPHLNGDDARQQLPTTNTQLLGWKSYGTKSSDLEGRGGLVSSTGGLYKEDSDDRIAAVGSGAMRSSPERGPQGNGFSRLLGEIDTSKKGNTTGLASLTPSDSRSQQAAGWNVVSSADLLEPEPFPKASHASEEYIMPGREDMQPVASRKGFRRQAQRLALLNDMMEAAAVTKANYLDERAGERPLGATTQLSTPVQSVIDVGTTPGRGFHTPPRDTERYYQPGQPQWQQQQQLAEGNRGQSWLTEQNQPSTADRLVQNPQEAVEESVETMEVLNQRYIEKPLRKRQRVVIVLEAIMSMISVGLLTRLTLTVMQSSNRRGSNAFLAGKALLIMWLGRRIFANLSFIGSAMQVLIQDLFLRKQRQHLLEVAGALRTLQEREQRA